MTVISATLRVVGTINQKDGTDTETPVPVAAAKEPELGVRRKPLTEQVGEGLRETMWGNLSKGDATYWGMWGLWGMAVFAGIAHIVITGKWTPVGLILFTGAAVCLSNSHNNKKRVRAAETAAAVEAYMLGREHRELDQVADVIPMFQKT